MRESSCRGEFGSQILRACLGMRWNARLCGDKLRPCAKLHGFDVGAGFMPALFKFKFKFKQLPAVFLTSQTGSQEDAPPVQSLEGRCRNRAVDQRP
jgi:hypothetical protein